ncbi:MAG: ComEC/Rec2 family competence protein [Sphingomonadaceae bacterium]|nr:ComEC/Rec2 family competence protein [Sphingomonadaceae bacterium]
MAIAARQRGSATPWLARGRAAMVSLPATIENWLHFQHEQWFTWSPLALAGGIIAWYFLPASGVLPFILCAMLSAFGTGWLLRRWAAMARIATMLGILLALGCSSMALRSAWVAAPVLQRPSIAQFSARVERVERHGFEGESRLYLLTARGYGLPPRIRVTVPDTDMPQHLYIGASVTLRARLMPPSGAFLPGGYDFAMRAWFDGIGAVGRAIGPIVVAREARDARRDDLRSGLSEHIRGQMAARPAALAAALASGDVGNMAPSDAEAMRRSGLAHLLSVSGLHITAVVGATIFLAMRLLALSPWLALRLPLPLISGILGALAAAGYTWITGGEVPTLRALIGALLLLLALAIGREALSLRVLAAAALVVMLLWPHALFGPSFQLSFAAMLAIVVLHSNGRVQALLMRREEGMAACGARSILGLILTGLAVELALIPIALFHFHRAGLYGAAANIIAIPLTTLVIMPLEALALLLDSLGIGAPIWWLVEWAINLLLNLAHFVAALPGAQWTMGVLPTAAFAAMIGGALWLLLILGRTRWLGCGLIATGVAMAWIADDPDILVSRDGAHVAARMPNGRYTLLRAQAGERTRDIFAEATGFGGDFLPLADQAGTRCSPDFCVWQMQTQGRIWTLMAARSDLLSPIDALARACAASDIVIAERTLPRACRPRWVKIDRRFLAAHGAVALYLQPPRITTARQRAAKPWDDPPTTMPRR